MDLRITTSGWIIIALIYTILITVSISATENDFHCFKKLHKTRSKRKSIISICGEPIYRTGERLFRGPKGCCQSGGVGYAKGNLEAIRKGSRKRNKYSCTLCKPKHRTTTTLSTLRITTVPDLFTTVTSRERSSDWSSCSVSCGVGFKSRRLCESNSCSQQELETVPCTVAQECPVDGGWGPWNSWSECSATCGGGNKSRTRHCNNPAPLHDGQKCPGDEVEALSCNENPCPVNGSWSEWSESDCSKTCGRGVVTRTRLCDNPASSGGGSPCDGITTENVKCELPKCPRHGGWSIWSDWSSCEISCGAGVQQRTRRCVAPVPKHGGNNCSGEDSQQQICYSTLPCPVNGDWSNWGSWGQCLAPPCTGERGNTTRKRTCKNPQPKFGGAMCEGNNTEIQGCINNQHCPVDGDWCDWSNFTECRLSDTGSFKIKTRDCGCPIPENGGQPCTGIDFEVAKCEEVERVTNRRCDTRDGISPEITESSGFTDDDDC